ncbi:MAG: hypothetical protein IIA89_12265 [Chloroflexi bacterium]|nr:hypothetical protein [Chloroflexota bacterium]
MILNTETAVDLWVDAIARQTALNEFDPPECAAEAHAKLIETFDLVVAGYTSLLAGDFDAATEQIASVTILMNEVVELLSELNALIEQ